MGRIESSIDPIIQGIAWVIADQDAQPDREQAAELSLSCSQFRSRRLVPGGLAWLSAEMDGYK